MPNRACLFNCVSLIQSIALLTSPAFAATPVFINELHYDNASTDLGEAIEIAGPAGIDLSGWSIVLYNGSPSVLAPYDTRVLSGTIADLGDGFGVHVEYFPTNGIQNGAPDGLALVDDAGSVVQFLSYEGALTAVSGPAGGMTSTDIGVSESSAIPAGFSLQLSGTGAVAEDFVWSQPDSQTFGASNTTQFFTSASGSQILINEVDADNAGIDNLEFVELYDGGRGNSELDGLTLVLYNGSSDAVYASFDLDSASTNVEGYYVLGNAAVAGVDLVFPDNTLQNGADAVALYRGDAADFPPGRPVVVDASLLDALVYDTSDPDDPGLLMLLGVGEPQIDENGNFNKDIESMQRCPNGSGGAAQSSVFALFTPTPGSSNICRPTVEITPIYTVQGNGTASPLTGATVTVEGVVSGDFQGDGAGVHGNLNGYFVQEEVGDGDESTSDGIFVFEATPAVDVSPGDRVQVTGTVTEFFGETQISAGAVNLLSRGNAIPAATVVLLGSALQTGPNDDDELIADLERFEGMLVTFEQTLAVTELFNLDRFGEVRLAQNGRLFQFTSTNQPDLAGFAEHLEDVARRTIMLDDGFTIQNPDPIRYPAPGLSTANTVRMGDTVTGLTGNLRFSRGTGGSGDQTYRLMPIIEPVFVPVNTRPTLAPSDSGRLRVAAFNIQNFFNDLRDGSGACFPSGTSSDCRGASNPAEFDRQLQKLMTALSVLDADVLGLVELENDYPDGDDSSIHELVAALNAQSTRCMGSYDYVVPPAGGRVGDDAIAVGLVYCNDTVALASGSRPAVLDDSLLADLGMSGPIFNGEASNRAPLAATFTERSSGQSITVVVNHFKSKGAGSLDDAGSACGVDIDPATEPNCDQLDGQGFWNLRRTEAALALGRWLDSRPTGIYEADILILGDLNAYPQEDPVKALEHLGYINLLQSRVAGPEPHSFVFDGQAGLLDYVLGSSTVVAQTSAVGVWQINADEADALDYNLDFGRSPSIFDGTLPFRASDHDPVVIGLDLQPDTDGDGVPDGTDNCILSANGPLKPDAGGNSQRDTDGDGFGNICDPDLDGSNGVDFSDLAVMKSVFFTNDPDADLDGNGSVEFSDLAIMKSLFFGQPGPSASVP